MLHRFLLHFFGLVLVASIGAAPAHGASETEVQTSWRLLDYIGVDYREAVASGKVINPAEFQEMVEFSAAVSAKLRALPHRAQKPAIVAEARALEVAIGSKLEPSDIARRAKGLAARLLVAYPVPLAPSSVPDLGRGAALYAQNCASCHGATGEGPSSEFAKLDPPPIAFADRERARDRSLFGLYQVITQGLEETAMQSYASLSEADRWALAFHAGTLAYRHSAKGKQLWEEDPSLRSAVPDLTALVALTPAELEARIGADKAAAVMAYLRANPGAVTVSGEGRLALARDRLGESLAAYARGARGEANQLALSAYLDGFEPIEAVLESRDRGLMVRTEQAMAGFRQAILRGDPPAALQQQLAEVEPLLAEAEAALAPESASDAATFLGAFAILLREGLEALLVVIAMIAFLRKAERRDALPYVHAGWVAALVAGVATWVAATYLIGISGRSRELAEGVGGLVAALVLLWVGVWMHGKAQADEWRRYIAAKMQGALSRGSAWFLFGLAFIVVYREAFETILFYAALWTSGSGAAMLAGALTAVALLAAIAWGMLRLSRTLPITQFFRYSAILIAILAVVLIGKGIGALQEAGTVGVTPLAGVPRLPELGLFPTAQSLFAQLLMAVALTVGFKVASRPRTEPVPAE